MITMVVDMTGFTQLFSKMADATDTKYLSQTVATSLRGAVKARIHNDGIASDGAPIGTYSKKYMVMRTGQYQNSKALAKSLKPVVEKVKRTPKAKVEKPAKETGEAKRPKGTRPTEERLGNKQAGIYTKGRLKGQHRPSFNRTTDPKIVISLTRDLEKSFNVVYDSGLNTYGLAYTDSGIKAVGSKLASSESKIDAVNHIYGKDGTGRGPIFDLTKDELDKVTELTDKFIKDIFK